MKCLKEAYMPKKEDSGPLIFVCLFLVTMYGLLLGPVLVHMFFEDEVSAHLPVFGSKLTVVNNSEESMRVRLLPYDDEVFWLNDGAAMAALRQNLGPHSIQPGEELKLRFPSGVIGFTVHRTEGSGPWKTSWQPGSSAPRGVLVGKVGHSSDGGTFFSRISFAENEVGS